MKTCKWCGAELIMTPKHKEKMFCSDKHRVNYQNKVKSVKRMIYRVAKANNFEIKNIDKIAKAKVMFFKDDDVKRCPCDQNNSNNFCGSEFCIASVMENGHCHCNLFHKKA